MRASHYKIEMTKKQALNDQIFESEEPIEEPIPIPIEKSIAKDPPALPPLMVWTPPFNQAS